MNEAASIRDSKAASTKPSSKKGLYRENPSTDKASFKTSKAATSRSPIQSDDSILDALAALDIAFAVFNCETQIIDFVTDGFTEILPMALKHQYWSIAFEQEPQAMKEFQEALASERVNHGVGSTATLPDASRSTKHILTTRLVGNKVSVEFKRLSGNQVLVSLCPIQNVTENLHQYMQMRDSLFSTSRTISVSEMATTLAHEINTPIGTITNILRGLKRRLAKPDTPIDVLDDALTRALEQTQFTQSVINRIRDFTQSRRPKHATLDIRDQITESVALLDWMLSQNGCRVVQHLPASPVYIDGDATMLQQVLINLLRNAVDAMEQQQMSQRFINIHVSTNDKVVTLSITDTGVGLESGTKNLFVPFSTNKAGGMGVGLNICRSFVELHQGRLWLYPNESEGCTSYIELPLAVPEASDEHLTETALSREDSYE